MVTDENICQAEAIKFILIEKTKDPKSQMKTTVRIEDIHLHELLLYSTGILCRFFMKLTDEPGTQFADVLEIMYNLFLYGSIDIY